MQGPAHEAPGPYADRRAGWREYFGAAAALMAANPPPVTDLAMLRSLAPLGLLEGFDPSRFSATDRCW